MIDADADGISACPVPAFDAGSPELLRGGEIGSQKKVVSPGDVLLSRIIPHIRRGWVVRENSDGRRQIASTEWIVFSSAEVVPGFLRQLLVSDFFHVSFMQTITGVGGSLSRANPGAVGEIKIPLPPLEVQKEIVAEFEGYQKVINGARAVLDHYRPHIPIHPDWPMVELGNACETIMDGTHFSPPNIETGARLYITSKNIRENYLDLSNISYISEEAHRSIYSRCPVKTGDVLYIKDGANTGLAAINTLTEEFSLLSSVAVMRGKPTILENRYLAFYLNSDHGRQWMLSMISGVAITRLTLTKLNAATIPLPPLATQQALVAEIEAEQALVAANRELITRFEQKIQATLARIWGSGAEVQPV